VVAYALTERQQSTRVQAQSPSTPERRPQLVTQADRRTPPGRRWRRTGAADHQLDAQILVDRMEITLAEVA
jgi:hypothetical protein